MKTHHKAGQWSLLRLLGEGGMAHVYEGQNDNGLRRAIKVARSTLWDQATMLELFEHEASAANSFSHDSAIEVLDLDTTEDGTPYLVLEYLDGETLAERVLRRGAVDVQELLGLMEQLLDCLVAAHDAGVIHRDIKPENIFIERDGTLKLLDFGVAAICGDDTLRLPATGVTVGTTAYMSPEQAAGRALDGRADVFSVGATMFRLLTGDRVHHADTEPELLMKMANAHAPKLGSRAPALAVELCAVVDRALAFDPNERYQSARSMLRDVRLLLTGDVEDTALLASACWCGRMRLAEAETIPFAPTRRMWAATNPQFG